LKPVHLVDERPAVATASAKPRPRFDHDAEARLEIAIAVENSRLYEELRCADHGSLEVLAMLAHEVRDPLVSITDAVRLLMHPGEVLAPDRSHLLEMMERQAETATRLVEDLMDITLINRGKIELRKEPIDLRPIVDRVVGNARPLIEERGLQFNVDFPAGPLRLEADPARLEQILWNLLSNAARSTDPGGRIRLAAEWSRGELIIRVRDSGVGIPPAMLGTIFDPFTQIEHLRGRVQGGLGPGLSLVRNLIELHGGSISAESEGTGKGSEFIIRLPGLTASTPSSSAPLRREEIADKPARRRVLVVDDNSDAARSLARVLTLLHGQDVRLANDGPSALELVEEFEPEIVFLDIGLPGMSGLEVAAALRARPEGEHCLLAAVTGWGQAKDFQRSRAAGFDFHLVKPVRPEALKEILTGQVKPRRS
jgi:CheY-like chemotaxis protein/nitrogen-specific signal transduction histidine kinase